jgi:hypothetical protein
VRSARRRKGQDGGACSRGWNVRKGTSNLLGAVMAGGRTGPGCTSLTGRSGTRLREEPAEEQELAAVRLVKAEAMLRESAPRPQGTEEAAGGVAAAALTDALWVALSGKPARKVWVELSFWLWSLHDMRVAVGDFSGCCYKLALSRERGGGESCGRT